MTTTCTSAAKVVTRILPTADVEGLVPAWEGLLGRSACDVPFLSPQWLIPWWRVFGGLDGRQPAIVTVAEGERLIGLAFLCLRWHRYRPGIPFRRLELWGSGESEADGVCSDYLNVISEGGREPEVAQEVARALASWSEPWHEMVAPLMDLSHPMPGLLARSFQSLGLRAELTSTTEAPYIPLPSSWDEYLEQLGRKERYLARRSLRDFEEWAAGTAILHEARTEEEVDAGAEALIRLHSERWEGTGMGTFRSPRFLQHHQVAMKEMHRKGGLRLSWISVRGEPVAAFYGLARSGKLCFYQCGRKMDVPRGLRLGGVMVLHAIRRAIEAGEKEFDFLGGEAVYKSQLALASRPLGQLRVARPGWRESARLGAEWCKGWLRGFLGKRAGAAPESDKGSQG